MLKSCFEKCFLKFPIQHECFFPVYFFQEFILFHGTRIPSFTQSLVAGSFMFITNNTPKRTLTDIKQNKHYLLELAF